jgi:CrcB protein
MILKILAVAAGGGVGATLRYLIFYFFERQHTSVFPWATLIVNFLGSFLIGFFWGYFDRYFVTTGIRLLIFVGLLGSFTTYSTYAFDVLSLFRDGEFKMMAIYLLGSNMLGIGLAFLGFYLTRVY